MTITLKPTLITEITGMAIQGEGTYLEAINKSEYYPTTPTLTPSLRTTPNPSKFTTQLSDTLGNNPITAATIWIYAEAQEDYTSELYVKLKDGSYVVAMRYDTINTDARYYEFAITGVNWSAELMNRMVLEVEGNNPANLS